MLRFVLTLTLSSLAATASGQDVDKAAGQRVVFLGDSITQSGNYIGFMTYYLEMLYPEKNFDLLGLGLASETLSGLSEAGHAGGQFPRPCLFERLERLLEKAKPDIVFACYGINDGIYQPLDKERFATFKNGIEKLIEKCKAAGVKHIFLVTPPIYDVISKKGQFNYDTVLHEYAKWELTCKARGVDVIDLHSAMRTARDGRDLPFSEDHVHPGDEGHLLMAKTILIALGFKLPDQSLAAIKSDPIFKLVEEKRIMRSAGWMKHIGYTRERTIKPEPLGNVELNASKVQEKIDILRRKRM